MGTHKPREMWALAAAAFCLAVVAGSTPSPMLSAGKGWHPVPQSWAFGNGEVKPTRWSSTAPVKEDPEPSLATVLARSAGDHARHLSRLDTHFVAQHDMLPVVPSLDAFGNEFIPKMRPPPNASLTDGASNGLLPLPKATSKQPPGGFTPPSMRSPSWPPASSSASSSSGSNSD